MAIDDEEIEEIDPITTTWFPGHMEKALKQISGKLKLVDIVLEIRDARAPSVSGNKEIESIINQKKRLIVFNKENLADPEIVMEWKKYFMAQGVPFLFINCFDKKSIKQLQALAKQIVTSVRPGEVATKKVQMKMMVIGIPNTGKSTLINQLATRAATKTGNRPGHTRAQQWINIDDTLYLLDTPGVIPPRLTVEEHRLWLCALHAVPDAVMGEELPARFLISLFLKKKHLPFFQRYRLPDSSHTTCDVEETVLLIAQHRGCLLPKGLPDLERVYKLILMDFRSGDLGLVCLESPPLDAPLIN